jgi:hypothetical protein
MSLFPEVPCSICNKPIVPLFFGFHDSDTRTNVHKKCKSDHYLQKFKEIKWQGLYSERPIIFNMDK